MKLGLLRGRTTTVLALLVLIATLVTSARGQIDGQLLDETEEDTNSYELKAGLRVRDVPLRNSVSYDGSKRFKCYSCEPPNCAESAVGTQVCQNAVQCWKSRVREGERSFVIF